MKGILIRRIKPFIDGKQIEYHGLLAQEELSPLYRKAAAVLFIINWHEPFGLVAVEAQASGTPIIATRFGALPEIIVDGKTGFIVDSVDRCCVAAVDKLDSISPVACRKNAEDTFQRQSIWLKGYSNVYKTVGFECKIRQSQRTVLVQDYPNIPR